MVVAIGSSEPSGQMGTVPDHHSQVIVRQVRAGQVSNSYHTQSSLVLWVTERFAAIP